MAKKKTKFTRFNVADYLVNEEMIGAYLSAILEEPSPKVYERALVAADEARKRHGLPMTKMVRITLYLDRNIVQWLKVEARGGGVSLETLINYILARDVVGEKRKRCQRTRKQTRAKS